MIVEGIGMVLFLVGLVSFFAGAMRAPASGSGPYGASGDALLIGGAIGVVFGVLIVVVGLL